MPGTEPLKLTYLSGVQFYVREEIDARIQRSKYFNDPALWAKEVLGVDLWYKQVEVCLALAVGDRRSVAVRAGHGVGKSFLASVLACWWIDTRPIREVYVASTAPSADQVTTILWREIRRFWAVADERHKLYLHNKKEGLPTEGLPDHRLPGRILGNNVWKDDLGNIIGQGRKPPDNKDEDSFQGLHARYLLAIGDEACGLRVGMIDALSNITTGVHCRRLLIGNPTNPRSRFGDIFMDDTPREMEEDGETVFKTLQDVWSLHHISVMDSPNFHGGGRCVDDCPHKAEHDKLPPGLGMTIEALEALVDEEYVTEKAAEYGKDSARFIARVLGQFAFDAGNNLFDDFILAQGRDATAFTEGESHKVVLGVDVSRSPAGDWSYIYSFTTGPMFEWVTIDVGEDVDGVVQTQTVLGPVGAREGGKLRFVDKYRGVPLVDTLDIHGNKLVGQATLIHQHAINLGASEVRVDSGGLGKGLIEALYVMAWGHYTVYEMQSGGPTPDGRSWYRNRDYQMDHMAKLMKEGLVDLDPGDKILLQQLGDITFEFQDPHGAMKIESKDSMKKRGVRSPDAADAAWYACADVSYLANPQDGDIATRAPEDIIEQLVLSGFHDPYEF